MSKGSSGGGAAPASSGRSTALSAGGVTWSKSPQAARAGDVAVKVSVAKLDAAWQRDVGYAFPAGSQGAFTGNKADMPRVHVDRSGVVSFIDGRHRFARARDSGKATVYVTVSRGSASRVKRLFGA